MLQYLLFIIIFISAGTASTETLRVYRQLSFKLPQHPDVYLANDPILGRLTCPPMIQYDLLKKGFSSINFAKIESKDEDATWLLTLQPRLKWWNGDDVTTSDLRHFLEKNLGSFLKSRVNASPKFQITEKKDSSVLEVKFTDPSLYYGPYILSGWPLFRPLMTKEKKLYECVGKYQVDKVDKNLIHLSLTPHNKSSRIQQLELRSDFTNADLSANGVWFKLGQDPKEKLGTRCTRTVDYPYFTALNWNVSHKPLHTAEVRQAVDALIPRHHISSYLLKGQVESVTGPFIPVHPGYDKTIMENKLKGSQALAILDQYWPESRQLKLCYSDGNEAMSQIIATAFKPYNIKVTLTPSEKPGDPACHAHVTTFPALWPDYGDVIRWSQDTHWAAHKKELESFAVNYLKTLGMGKPDFAQLSKLHRLLADSKLMSVIGQHKACIEAGNGFKRPLPPLIVRNLSWFEDLLK